MSMGERIKDLRIQKGYTQEELGKILGVKKAAIQKYESGTVSNLKRSKIKLLADALNVTPSFLMGWESFDEEHNTEELSNENKLIDEIKNAYGKDAVELLHKFLELNELGVEKALDYVYDLTEQSKYTEN